MGTTKLIWRDVALKRLEALNQMHVVTNQIAKSLVDINLSLDLNESDSLEGINHMITRREETIALLDMAIKKEGNNWSEDEQYLLQQLDALEETIQPRLSELYQAFSEQMKNFQQTKSTAKKYKQQTPYYTDGTFFDQRK